MGEMFLLGFTAGYSNRDPERREHAYVDGHEQGSLWREEDDRQNAAGVRLIEWSGGDPASLEVMEVVVKRAQERERDAIEGTLERL
jgi:hypothetical protein